MKFLSSLDIFDESYKEIPCIPGSGAPTTSVEGAVGSLYMDTDNGDLYKCISTDDGVYVWTAVGGAGGLGGVAKTLLITILRNGVYTTDQSANITALETVLGESGGGGGDEPDVPVTPDVPDVPVVGTYSIASELVNVNSSNNASSVNEGVSYTTTLTAVDGYMLPSTMGGSVTVIMGTADITSEVYNYNSGKITITSVTGNIVIRVTAFPKPKLIEDGLESFFDLRTVESSINGNYKYISATKGNGGLFYNKTAELAGTERGTILGNSSACYTKSENISWENYDGTDYQYTIVVCYYAPDAHNYSCSFPNFVLAQTHPYWYPKIKYVNTSGEAVTKKSDICTTSATKAGFMVGAISVGANNAVFATADGVLTTFDASEYEDFDHFDAYSYSGIVNPNKTVDSVTFFAVYNRALSTDEMSEVFNYMMMEVAG